MRSAAMKNWTRGFCFGLAGLSVLTVVAPNDAGAECYVQAPLRPVHRTFIRRDVVEPGVYEVSRRASQHGVIRQQVAVAGNVVWRETPPVYKTVTVRVRKRGGSIWSERCVGGQAAVCRVRVPPQDILVEKQVLVRPGRRWAEQVAPDAVALTERRVLLRPYKNYAHFQRPYIAFSRERVAVQPEGARWVPAPSQPQCCEPKC
ncbi:hypothetical protein [Rhodomicrobium udaipurense]|uniref:Uncharacterized protein n=1 Tax=Rhodomicrobium udaipurense TaxID=1202716 RepID=A0A8I1GBQ0_9HYPH|nr:hypothetical protein [Rhodomicrobium udaipurense]MBJ7542850.1 hypothetical protein [Rhodomicrobium udaipurense]